MSTELRIERIIEITCNMFTHILYLFKKQGGKMPNMTLAIPADLKEKMDHFKEINWSEVARQAINQKVSLLEKMNRLFSKSRLSGQDTEKYAAVIRKNVFKKHKVS